MKRIFAGRMVLFFCCLAGLAWASWGLFNSSPGVAISNDALMSTMVGKWGKHACNTLMPCPSALCVPPSGLNSITFENGGWSFDWEHPGESGCSANSGTYKVCGPIGFGCWWCAENKAACGAYQIPVYIPVFNDDGKPIKVITFCGDLGVPCAKGC